MSRKILIVDDEPDIVELLKYNLEKEGYTCHTASNGHEALAIANKVHPQLILLDIMMPELRWHRNMQEIKGKRRIQRNVHRLP